VMMKQPILSPTHNAPHLRCGALLRLALGTAKSE
jgi:hypothetical protein